MRKPMHRKWVFWMTMFVWTGCAALALAGRNWMALVAYLTLVLVTTTEATVERLVDLQRKTIDIQDEIINNQRAVIDTHQETIQLLAGSVAAAHQPEQSDA